MPTKEKVPEGPHRRFVQELFVHYREAGRPSLREIASWIESNADSRNLRGTASTETIRRIMNGSVIPSRWAVVETVLEALCGIAERSTAEPRHEEYDRWDTPTTLKEELKKLWNGALDQTEGDDDRPGLPPRPAHPEPVTAPADDPWATGPSSGFGGSTAEPPY